MHGNRQRNELAGGGPRLRRLLLCAVVWHNVCELAVSSKLCCPCSVFSLAEAPILNA